MFLHLDLDCFFVSAHRTVDKSLKNIPVAVGGRSNLNIFSSKKEKREISQNGGAFVSTILTNEGKKSFKEYFVDENGKIRGIITTSSYEARAYGVKTAMSVNEALRLCPKLKMIPPNYPLYHQLSTQLHNLLKKELPLIEQFSIDEFFADLNGYIPENEIQEFANYLKNKIKEELDLPVSIGIAHSKYLSKLITEYAKPDGIKYIKEENIRDFIKDIPIGEFPGIGKRYEQRLNGYGIKTLGDIESKKELFYSWKKPGIEIYNRVCGINDNKLNLQKDKKSIGIGRSFDAVYDRNEILRRLIILCRFLSFSVKKNNKNPLSYALYIKYESKTKSKSFVNVNKIFNEENFKTHIKSLFLKNDIHPTHGVIQLNITVYNFSKSNEHTYDIFDYKKDLKKRNLGNKIQELREKYGIDIIKNAVEIKKDSDF